MEEETLESLLALSAMCGHSQKVAVCKSGSELSPEHNHIGALASDFQPPELKNAFLLFKPPC